jgi:hypothetical protein
VLWICVPHRVEEDLVLHDVGQENGGSVLGFTPPWSELVEAFVILTFKNFVLVLGVSDLESVLQERVKVWKVFILEPDFELSSLEADNVDEYSPVERV